VVLLLKGRGLVCRGRLHCVASGWVHQCLLMVRREVVVQVHGWVHRAVERPLVLEHNPVFLINSVITDLDMEVGIAAIMVAIL